MINLTTKSKGPLDRNSLSSINQANVQGSLTAQNISVLNKASVSKKAQGQPRQAHTSPPLLNPIQKGQKAPLESTVPLRSVKACFGWNTTNPQCDVDVSAFLLGANGKVPGDSWFVFYGQPVSPDKSCRFQTDTIDREIIDIDFGKLNSGIQKIVFVLTINDAFEKKLNFGMMKDAYIRILNREQELVSFKMTDYYTNVISMMIGELYLHNGKWKFNAIGNGVAKDLAGLCAMYGVQVSD